MGDKKHLRVLGGHSREKLGNIVLTQYSMWESIFTLKNVVRKRYTVKPDVFYNPELPEVKWYEPLHNKNILKTCLLLGP